MKRFNLLLVNKVTGLCQETLKALSKVYRSNFVFEVETMTEAEKMLKKLHLDCIVIDLDEFQADFMRLSKENPNLLIFGICKQPNKLEMPIFHERNKIFAKSEFIAALQIELKQLRKSNGLPQKKVIQSNLAAPANASDFQDFSKLISISN